MRRIWLLIAVVLLGLWAWSQEPGNEVLPAPVAGSSATVPAVANAPAARSGTARARSAAITPATAPSRYPDFLPFEAHAVLDTLARGGPYAYRQDGNVFQNRERRLPVQPHGYYREYTVATPGSPDRGPRRIVTGGGAPNVRAPGSHPPHEYWYSADHYRSFRRFELSAAPP